MDMMKTLKRGIIKSKLNTDSERTLWAMLLLHFLGSLRGLEILGTDPLTFDPIKTLFGADVKVLELVVDGNKVHILQLRRTRQFC